MLETFNNFLAYGSSSNSDNPLLHLTVNNLLKIEGDEVQNIKNNRNLILQRLNLQVKPLKIQTKKTEYNRAISFRQSPLLSPDNIGNSSGLRKTTNYKVALEIKAAEKIVNSENE